MMTYVNFVTQALISEILIKSCVQARLLWIF